MEKIMKKWQETIQKEMFFIFLETFLSVGKKGSYVSLRNNNDQFLIDSFTFLKSSFLFTSFFAFCFVYFFFSFCLHFFVSFRFVYIFFSFRFVYFCFSVRLLEFLSSRYPTFINRSFLFASPRVLHSTSVINFLFTYFIVSHYLFRHYLLRLNVKCGRYSWKKTVLGQCLKLRGTTAYKLVSWSSCLNRLENWPLIQLAQHRPYS